MEENEAIKHKEMMKLIKWGKDYGYKIEFGFEKAEEFKSYLAWRAYILEKRNSLNNVIQQLDDLQTKESLKISDDEM